MIIYAATVVTPDIFGYTQQIISFKFWTNVINYFTQLWVKYCRSQPISYVELSTDVCFTACCILHKEKHFPWLTIYWYAISCFVWYIFPTFLVFTTAFFNYNADSARYKTHIQENTFAINSEFCMQLNQNRIRLCTDILILQ